MRSDSSDQSDGSDQSDRSDGSDRSDRSDSTMDMQWLFSPQKGILLLHIDLKIWQIWR